MNVIKRDTEKEMLMQKKQNEIRKRTIQKEHCQKASVKNDNR